jgi:hypothetical protein
MSDAFGITTASFPASPGFWARSNLFWNRKHIVAARE